MTCSRQQRTVRLLLVCRYLYGVAVVVARVLVDFADASAAPELRVLFQGQQSPVQHVETQLCACRHLPDYGEPPCGCHRLRVQRPDGPAGHPDPVDALGITQGYQAIGNVQIALHARLLAHNTYKPACDVYARAPHVVRHAHSDGLPALLYLGVHAVHGGQPPFGRAC
ncbi:MAG: hypothetical protein PUG76_06725, partial [Prevotellaceae bacterium]|nr:hypothetical protein [Prevotellaceae bacterium]